MRRAYLLLPQFTLRLSILIFNSIAQPLNFFVTFFLVLNVALEMPIGFRQRERESCSLSVAKQNPLVFPIVLHAIQYISHYSVYL